MKFSSQRLSIFNVLHSAPFSLYGNFKAIEHRIKAFADLPSGWGFGAGEPITSEVIDKALYLLRLGEKYGLLPEVSPGSDGSITLSFVNQDDAIQLNILPDGTVDLIHEVGIGVDYDEVDFQENTSIEVIDAKLNALKRLTSWHLSEYFTSGNTAYRVEDLQVTHSKPIRVVYPLSIQTVSSTPLRIFAHT